MRRAVGLSSDQGDGQDLNNHDNVAVGGAADNQGVAAGNQNINRENQAAVVDVAPGPGVANQANGENAPVDVAAPVGVAAAAMAVDGRGRGETGKETNNMNNETGPLSNMNVDNIQNDIISSPGNCHEIPSGIEVNPQLFISNPGNSASTPNALVSVCSPLGSELPQNIREK